MICLAVLLIALGLIFCFVHKLPGQLLAFIGMLVLKFTTEIPIPGWALITCAILVIVSMIVDGKVLPNLMKKIHEFGKASNWGTFLGSVVSLIVLSSVRSTPFAGIVCFFILPYAFAYLFELAAVKNNGEALQRAGAAYTVFLCSTLIKLIVVALCIYIPIRSMAN